MGYVIDSGKFDSDVVSVVNASNKNIKSSIESFNKNIATLANGTNWRGASAVENVRTLVNFYNTYMSAYSDFIKKLNTTCQAALEGVNDIILTNRGVVLSFDTIESLVFDKPQVQDLTFAGGESGDPTVMIQCATSFSESAKNIKNGYLNIKTAFEKIGVGSQILDTSAFGTDYATKLKNGVIDAIDSLVQINDNEFNTCITNITNAAKNIQNG